MIKVLFKKQRFTLQALLVGFLVLVSCQGQAKTNETLNSGETSEKETAVPVKINKVDFLKKIYNYEASPNEWKYLGNKPAIIDFYADWCGPCKAIAPSLDQLAKEYAGQIDIYKVDVDKETELAKAFGIQGIPALLYIPMEGKPQMLQGAQPKEVLKEKIETILLKK